MSWYTVTLLDHDGCTMASAEHGKLSAAKADARAYLVDPEYAGEDVAKVEVRDEAGVCVWDQLKEEVL